MPPPTCIVARTEKGHGVSFLADKDNWHGKALSAEEAERAIAELGGARSVSVTPPAPPAWKPAASADASVALPTYDGVAIATRKAFGETLAALAARSEVVALDAEVSNSTYTEDFQKVAPERFIETYIAEQAMVGAAVGLQVLGKVPFAATFAAFLTRAYDFVRMAAISRADVRLCGSHAGVSIGEDGPSQMALEDLAMMRAIHGSTVLYPSDGNATAALTAAMADRAGISYLRSTREKTAAIYAATERFPIGGSKVHEVGTDPRVTLVGAGITFHECLAAAQDLFGVEVAPPTAAGDALFLSVRGRRLDTSALRHDTGHRDVVPARRAVAVKVAARAVVAVPPVCTPSNSLKWASPSSSPLRKTAPTRPRA